MPDYQLCRQQYLRYLGSLGRSSSTINGYGKVLRYFDDFLTGSCQESVPIENITALHIEDFLIYLAEDRHYADVSRRRAHAILKGFFAYTCKRSLTSGNPALDIDSIRPEQKERTYLTMEEVSRIMAACPHSMIRLAIQLTVCTGLRVGEVLNLKNQDVDLQQQVIHVRQGKGKKDRLVPIPQTLEPGLRQYQAGHDNTPARFFLSTRTGSLSRAYFDRILRQAAQAAGITRPVSPHCLRHSYATHLVNNNVDLIKVQKLLGHASLNTTAIYIHTNLNDLHQAVDSCF